MRFKSRKIKIRKRWVLGPLALLLGLGILLLFRGPEGHWYGTLSYNNVVLRIAQVIEKDGRGGWTSRYDSFDYGTFDVPLKEVVKNGRFLHMVTQEGGVLDLWLHYSGETLSGTSTSMGLTGDVVLHRGRRYGAPRVGWFDRETATYRYRRPKNLRDGLETGDLRKEGVDLPLVESGVGEALKNRDVPHLFSLLVMHGGRLVLEEYFFGYGPQDVFRVRSVTASVFSILFGIAQDRELVSTDEKLYDYFPEYRKMPGWQAGKDRITLGMMLSMTGGFECDDLASPRNTCLTAMWGSKNWVEFALTGRLAREPGTHFAYCSPCLIPPAMAVDRKSRMIIPEFANKNLFAPLGIPSPRWILGPDGVPEIEGGLFLTPRDMAKLGCLMLNKGEWKGKRIVSEGWVEASTSPKVRLPDGRDFCYLWTREKVSVRGQDVDVFYTMGRGGQYIWVAPEKDLVVVTTAGNYRDDELSAQPFQLFKNYILSAF